MVAYGQQLLVSLCQKKLYKVVLREGVHNIQLQCPGHLAPHVVQPGLLIKYDPGKTGILASVTPQFEYLNLFANFWSARHFSGGKDLLFSSDI